MNEKDGSIPLERLSRVAWFLDNSIRIPGIDYRIGIDPLIGFIPGIGDAVGALLSMYIVAEGARARLPRVILTRMVFNVALETIIGAIPLVGDLFDMTWKANARNARLIREYAASPQAAAISSRRVIWPIAALLVFLMIAAVYVSFAILRWLWLALST